MFTIVLKHFLSLSKSSANFRNTILLCATTAGRLATPLVLRVAELKLYLLKQSHSLMWLFRMFLFKILYWTGYKYITQTTSYFRVLGLFLTKNSIISVCTGRIRIQQIWGNLQHYFQHYYVTGNCRALDQVLQNIRIKRQGKAKQGKARQGKARQGKAAVGCDLNALLYHIVVGRYINAELYKTVVC